MPTRLENLSFSITHPNPTRLERMMFEVTTDLNNIKSEGIRKSRTIESITTQHIPTKTKMLNSPVYTKLWGQQAVDEANAKTTAALKPKVYYKTQCITDDEAEVLKLKRDDEGYYTRSTKIQDSVKTYLDLPGQALDIFPYGQTYDREINAVRREKIKKHGAKYDKEMGVWYAETRKDARALIAAGYRVDNHPDNWRIKKTEVRNRKIDPRDEDRTSWENWCYNSLTETWIFENKETYYRTWG